ncbi:MAG: hypothetical protein HZB26_06385 [Candidatus Hydrogenedentes bacterium]|nr:hypothetical protein [Candidatus Hydrogenedentota bacterium]
MMASHDLYQWLDAATRGLCRDARERVAQEIRAHFSDAFNSAFERGLTRADAYVNALKGLGSARAARRAYRRAYLTMNDERRLGVLSRSKKHFRSDSTFQLVLLTLYFVCHLGAVTSGFDDIGMYAAAKAGWGLGLSVLGFYLVVKLWIIPMLCRNGQARFALALACLVESVYWIIVLGVPSVSSYRVSSLGTGVEFWTVVIDEGLFFLTLFVPFKAYLNLPLWWKLRARERSAPEGWA